MPAYLHHIWVTDRDTPERVLFVLHGILGSGQNFGTLARKLVEARPEWGILLVDLRQHGRSGQRPDPQTLHAAAQDLLELESSLPGLVHGVIGHSFGGKVAASFAALREQPLDRLWMLDSPPGQRTAGAGSESTLHILDILEAAPRRSPSRTAFTQHLEAQGLSSTTAQWLAMNLRREQGEFELNLDLGAIRALLTDYFRTDLWPWIEQTSIPTTLVRAAKSDLWSEEEQQRAVRLSEELPHLQLRVVPDAGHWLHVDNPEGTLQAVLADLPAG